MRGGWCFYTTHHITEQILKVAINTITWVWTKSLIIHTVTFRGIVNVEKIYCDIFPVTFFPTCLVTFYPGTFFRLPFMYCIYDISFIGSDVRK
jgi:hypothetical protein